VISSPAIWTDGTIYVGSRYQLFAINLDGTEKWTFATGGLVHSSPAISTDGTIYVGSADFNLYAINTDGTEKWNFTTGNVISSSPAIGSDGTIYAGSDDFNLYAINPDGTEKWNFTTDAEVTSSPAIWTDGTIYVGSRDYRLYAINPDGSEKWRFPTGDFIYYSSPAISSDGTIYIGSCDNKLYAINPDGTEKWSYVTGNDVVSSPAIGSDGTIYVGSFNDKLYAFRPLNIPPIAEAGFDQTVNEGEVVKFNGSASYDPDGTIVLYEWDFNTSDGLWWETGASPDAVGLDPTYSYDDYGIYNVTLRVTDNNGSMDTDTCEIIVLVPPPLPPFLYINMSFDGSDVILYWNPPSTPSIDHYLIYRSTSQIDFDFNSVWVNTSADNESGEPTPIPLRTMWNDTKAALPGDPNYEKEYYYIIRAVNILGEISDTSRTVGKWTKTFPQGVSTFSLPLELLSSFDTEWYTSNMNADYIKYINTTTHIWMQHNFGDGTKNNTQMKLGEGYEVKFNSQTNYTFTGMPGAMIRNNDIGFLGFDPGSDSKNLTASVNTVTGNITLNWTKPSSVGNNDQYHVLRSTIRDGFWNGNYIQLANLSFNVLSYTDISNATEGTQYYYIIVPVNETEVEGTSTYSVGVWTEEYLSQYDTFGLPLKLDSNQTADWYCDIIPDTVGINFFNVNAQWWSWHSTRMPEGAFDPDVVMAEGYQISTIASTKYSFIGI